MSAEFAPIGSVVRIKDVRLVVIGHRMARDGESIGMCYLLVPYPLGFVDASSLSLTPASKIDEVVSRGYETDEGNEYLTGLQGMAESAKGVGYDDFADAVLSFNNYLKEKGGQDE